MTPSGYPGSREPRRAKHRADGVDEHRPPPLSGGERTAGASTRREVRLTRVVTPVSLQTIVHERVSRRARGGTSEAPPAATLEVVARRRPWRAELAPIARRDSRSGEGVLPPEPLVRRNAAVRLRSRRRGRAGRREARRRERGAGRVATPPRSLCPVSCRPGCLAWPVGDRRAGSTSPSFGRCGVRPGALVRDLVPAVLRAAATGHAHVPAPPRVTQPGRWRHRSGTPGHRLPEGRPRLTRTAAARARRRPDHRLRLEARAPCSRPVRSDLPTSEPHPRGKSERWRHRSLASPRETTTRVALRRPNDPGTGLALAPASPGRGTARSRDRTPEPDGAAPRRTGGGGDTLSMSVSSEARTACATAARSKAAGGSPS